MVGREREIVRGERKRRRRSKSVCGKKEINLGEKKGRGFKRKILENHAQSVVHAVPWGNLDGKIWVAPNHKTRDKRYGEKEEENREGERGARIVAGL